MQAGEPARVFRRQLQPGLVAVYGLMLRAVVHEHALDIRHEGNRDHIADQNRDARQSGGKVDDKAAVRSLADERRHARGQRDKQEQAQRDGKHHRDGHDNLVDARAQLLGEPLFKLAGLFLHHAEHLRALVEGFHAHFEHDHHVDAAADQRQPHPLVLFGERLVVLARHHDPAVRTAHRDGDGFIRRALHHHAFHDGLPADILILMLLIAHCASSFLGAFSPGREPSSPRLPNFNAALRLFVVQLVALLLLALLDVGHQQRQQGKAQDKRRRAKEQRLGRVFVQPERHRRHAQRA